MQPNLPPTTVQPDVTADASPPVLAQRASWAGVGLFVLLAFGLSWTAWLGLCALGVPFTIRASIGMFGPALAALLVRGPLRHEGFADAGLRLWSRGPDAGRRESARGGEPGIQERPDPRSLPAYRPGGWRYYLAGYLLIPVLLAAGIVLALLIGYQHWVNPVQTLEALLRRQLASANTSVTRGLSLSQVATISLVTQVALAFTFAIPFNMIFTFGEEFGWRGYLLPRLAGTRGPYAARRQSDPWGLGGTGAALVVGVVWGLWHAPLIVLDGYNYPGHYPGHPWAGVAMMVLFTTACSLVFAWLRLRTGSVWPSTLAHAALNAQAGFALLLLSKGDSLLRPPVGVIGLLPVLAFGLWLAASGRLRPALSAR